MDNLINSIISLLETYGAWAGPILGIIAFCESLAIVGLFVPATAVMLMIGGLVGGGLIDPISVFIWSVLGSIAGDSISYAIGRRIGPSIYYRRPLTNHRALVARTRLFFRRYGFWSVLIGRFLGPIRSTIPLVAGVMRMPRRPFQLANVLSAFLWVPLMLAPGFITGRSIGGLDALTGTHWWIAIGVIAAICLLVPLIIARFLTRRFEGPPRVGERLDL